MTEQNGHDQISELEQCRQEIMDDARLTRSATMDLLDEQKALFGYLRSTEPLMGDHELHGIQLSEIRAKEDRLDEINQKLGSLSVNDTESTE